MVLIKQMLLLFWKNYKVVLGCFVFPQHIFAFSPNHYLLSLALRSGNTSLAQIILQKNQNRHHIIYPGWHPVLCYVYYTFRKCLHYKARWMFFKIKSDYWLERFLLLLLCREILQHFIVFSTAEKGLVPSALPSVLFFRFYEAFHYMNYGW